MGRSQPCSARRPSMLCDTSKRQPSPSHSPFGFLLPQPSSKEMDLACCLFKVQFHPHPSPTVPEFQLPSPACGKGNGWRDMRQTSGGLLGLWSLERNFKAAASELCSLPYGGQPCDSRRAQEPPASSAPVLSQH